jgi:serine/threonine-protein kinase
MRNEERDSWRRADALLAELLDLPAGERRAAVERALSAHESDPDLKRRLEVLLASLDRATGPLDIPLAALDFPAVPEAAGDSLRGRRLGAYVLDEEIGRGGMAVVYAAHRADGAFEQQVAVKVLGTGLLPTSATERFRREQELLARLHHPHIATLLDGGVADDGTPFLVMERIDGVAIDRYCDGRGLGPRDRVELLLQVCDAVAWAHRNLVVHRDIKPGNVLVTGAGDAKLLDFGIAKLLEPDGSAREATQARSRLLTPGYAAPEQLTGATVTTATDVYGLGRILERLLAGHSVDADLANIRAHALHPDPERRYADARTFAEDLQRWREGRPVEATPDSWNYRLRKWAVRRRGVLAAAALILGVGAAGVATTVAKAAAARRAEREAAAVSAFLVGLFEASDPAENRGREPAVRELLDRGVEETRGMKGEPLLRARLFEVLGGVFLSLGRYDRATEQARAAIEILEQLPEPPEARLAELRDHLGVGLAFLDRFDEAERELDAALAARRRLFGDSHATVAETLNHLGVLEGVLRGNCAAAEPLLAESLAIRRGLEPPQPLVVANSLNDLGRCLSRLRRTEDAEAALAEALGLHRAHLGDDHPHVADDLNGLANALSRGGDPARAVPLQREALALRRKLFGDRHADVAQSLNSLGVALEQAGELGEAERTLREALALYRDLFGSGHSSVRIAANNLVLVLLQIHQPAEAERLCRASLDGAGGGRGGDRERLRARIGLGSALRELGRPGDAEAELLAALEQAAVLSDDPILTARAELELGRLELDRDRPAEAERLFAASERRLRELLGSANVNHARSAAWLGIASARLGGTDEAAADLDAALGVLSRHLPPDHPDVARASRELERLAPGGGLARR